MLSRLLRATANGISHLRPTPDSLMRVRPCGRIEGCSGNSAQVKGTTGELEGKKMRRWSGNIVYMIKKEELPQNGRMAERLWRVAQVCVSYLVWLKTDFLISHGETRVGSNPTPLIFLLFSSSLFSF
jgi:hypothetical protein